MMHSTALSLPQLLAATWEAREKNMNFWQIRPTVSRNTQSRMMEAWHKKIIT